MTHSKILSTLVLVGAIASVHCGSAANSPGPGGGAGNGGVPQGGSGGAGGSGGSGGSGGTGGGGGSAEVDSGTQPPPPVDAGQPVDSGTQPPPQDAGPPPPPRDAGAIQSACPLDPTACGPVFVVNAMQIGNEQTGFDYTGDGRVDNRLASIGGWTIPGILPKSPNEQLQEQINSGGMLLLAEIRGLDDPTGQNDNDVTVALYSSRDSDCTQPANAGTAGCNPGDNFSGTEAFCVLTESLELVTFRPKYVFAGATIQNGLLEAGPSTFAFPLPLGGATVTLTLQEARIKARVGAGLSGLTEGVLGGILPVNALDKIPIPNNFAPDLSVFDALVSVKQVTPDLDLAGDGLEKYAASGGFFIDICCKPGATNCRTASSSQRINQANDKACPQDPAVDDGYSAGLSFTAVPAGIKGIVSRTPCP